MHFEAPNSIAAFWTCHLFGTTVKTCNVSRPVSNLYFKFYTFNQIVLWISFNIISYMFCWEGRFKFWFVNIKKWCHFLLAASCFWLNLCFSWVNFELSGMDCTFSWEISSSQGVEFKKSLQAFIINSFSYSCRLFLSLSMSFTLYDTSWFCTSMF